MKQIFPQYRSKETAWLVAKNKKCQKKKTVASGQSGNYRTTEYTSKPDHHHPHHHLIDNQWHN